MTSTLFQGHSSVKQFELKLLCYLIRLKCYKSCQVHEVTYEYTTIFDFLTYLREVTDVFPELTKNFDVFFADIV